MKIPLKIWRSREFQWGLTPLNDPQWSLTPLKNLEPLKNPIEIINGV